MNNDIDDFELLKLVGRMLGKPIDEYDEDEIVDAFDYEFGFSIWDFQKAVEYLVPMITVAQSPIDGRIFRGFAINGEWLIKQEVKNGK